MPIYASYLLHYEAQPYQEPTPMACDQACLCDEVTSLVPDDFLVFDGGLTIFVGLPRGAMEAALLQRLLADQVFERREGALWMQLAVEDGELLSRDGVI